MHQEVFKLPDRVTPTEVYREYPYILDILFNCHNNNERPLLYEIIRDCKADVSKSFARKVIDRYSLLSQAEREFFLSILNDRGDLLAAFSDIKNIDNFAEFLVDFCVERYRNGHNLIFLLTRLCQTYPGLLTCFIDRLSRKYTVEHVPEYSRGLYSYGLRFFFFLAGITDDPGIELSDFQHYMGLFPFITDKRFLDLMRHFESQINATNENDLSNKEVIAFLNNNAILLKEDILFKLLRKYVNNCEKVRTFKLFAPKIPIPPNFIQQTYFTYQKITLLIESSIDHGEVVRFDYPIETINAIRSKLTAMAVAKRINPGEFQEIKRLLKLIEILGAHG